MKRLPKIMMFNGKRYERAGLSGPEPKKSVAQSWAKFQRDVNGYNARVVKALGAGWEIYLRKAKGK